MLETVDELYEKFDAIVTERGIGYRGVYDLYGLDVNKRKTVGSASISAFEIDKNDMVMYNLRHYVRHEHQMMVKAGKYVRLHINGTLYMSDTYMEYITNMEFLEHANGDVLIAGLGIGLILHNLSEKLRNGTITSITVVENNNHVITLIAKYFTDHRIKVVHADIFYYVPKNKALFDTIYFDIWESICSDNLEDMKKLRNRFSKNLRITPTSWMGSWEEKKCLEMKYENNFN